jgi:hypothetical protein
MFICCTTTGAAPSVLLVPHCHHQHSPAILQDCVNSSHCRAVELMGVLNCSTGKAAVEGERWQGERKLVEVAIVQLL